MATQHLVADKRLCLSVPVGGGRKDLVYLEREEIPPTLLFASDQPMADGIPYQDLADRLLGEEWNPKRVYVTSPTHGDGKTCTAFNLAWTLSTRGNSVLLIELNFARPRFRSLLGGIRIPYGVDCAIRRWTHPANTVCAIENQLLSLSSIKTVTGRRDLRQNLPHLASYVNWCGSNFDWLVLDCPPVLSSGWNSWFRKYARTTLLVVREEHTPLVQVRSAAKRLGSNLKGVLLNDVAGPTPATDWSANSTETSTIP